MGSPGGKDLAISVCTKCDRQGLVSRKTGTCVGERIRVNPNGVSILNEDGKQILQKRSTRCDDIASRKAARS